MKRNIIFTAFVMILLSLYVLPVSAAESTSETAKKANTTEFELLFFMNPHGRPCQYQDQILSEINETLEKIAPVKYYKTTNRADHQAFRMHGVRGLPMVVVVDKKGNAVKRFSPGVQRKETILAALDQLKK